MTRDARPRRQMARQVMRLARVMMPDDAWSKAMASEIENISDDAECLKWAIGCAFASAHARGKHGFHATIRSPKMRRKALVSLSLMLAIFIVATGGIYASLKPYQKDRLAIWLAGGSRTPNAHSSVPQTL